MPSEKGNLDSWFKMVGGGLGLGKKIILWILFYHVSSGIFFNKIIIF